MRIGISVLSEPKMGTGVSRYASNLIKALAAIDNENEYYIFGMISARTRFTPQGSNFRYIGLHMPLSSKLIRRIVEQLYLPFAVRKYKLDIIHTVNNVIPLLAKVKRLATVHDVIFRKIPNKRFRGIKKLYYDLFATASIRRADKVLTVSNRSKNDIVELFKLDPDRIVVIDNGCDEFLLPVSKEEIDRAKMRYAISGDYLLTVGIQQPVKNMISIIEAFIKLKDKNIKLVIAGPCERETAQLKKLVDKYDIKRRVVFTGYVIEQGLRALYKGAKAFVFLSLNEGFGLPVLEAMASGTPVVASNIEPISEFASSQKLVKPTDNTSVAREIDHILKDPSLNARLSADAIKQAKDYTWEKCARKTLNVYKGLT